MTTASHFDERHGVEEQGDRAVAQVDCTADAACALLFVAALSLMRQPQVFVGVALFALAAVFAALLIRRTVSGTVFSFQQSGSPQLKTESANSVVFTEN